MGLRVERLRQNCPWVLCQQLLDPLLTSLTPGWGLVTAFPKRSGQAQAAVQATHLRTTLVERKSEGLLIMHEFIQCAKLISETFLQFGRSWRKTFGAKHSLGGGRASHQHSPSEACAAWPKSVGVLSFLGLVWFPVPCSLGFCLEAKRLFGELRVSLDAPHTEMSIVW